MNDRLKQFLSMENLSPARFAEVMGIQRSGISHLLAGRNKPSFEFIQKMMTAYPDINYEWLILGKGRPYKSDRQPASSSVQTELFTDSSDPVAHSTDEITPDNQFLIDENPASEPPENRIFSDDAAPALPKLSKKIARIIVFFNDGTYEEK